ncbi:MAG TPA: hypothetical protein VIM73_10945 [Polyangiaceae bacterium]
MQNVKRAVAQVKRWVFPVLLSFAVLGFCSTLCSNAKKDPPKVSTTPAPKPKPSKPQRCVIQIPKHADANPTGFPLESGLDEFTRAAVAGDERGMGVAARANGGAVVQSGTSCTWLDVGLLRTKVRITEGRHEGKALWFPTEWTRGE